MDLSENGEILIKSFEGFSLVGYLPTSSDKNTIGYGSTHIFGRLVILGEKITEEQAEEQFQKDVSWAINTVNKLVKVDLNQNQFDALVSLCYNIGGTLFTSSTLLKLLNNEDYSGAADQFLVWDTQNHKVLQGLLNRRQKERDLFLSGD
jgi:lysozyme